MTGLKVSILGPQIGKNWGFSPLKFFRGTSYIPGHIPGAAAPSEALDPAKGLCRLKSMKKPIFLLRNIARQFLNEFSDVA